MRFALSDDQIQFRKAVRTVLADTCGPDALRAAWADADLAGGGPGGGDGTVPAAWDALADMGVLGVCVPEGHGGLGLTDEDLVPLLMEVGHAALPEPVSSTAGVAASLLAHHVPSATAAPWLSRLAEGEVRVGIGFLSGARGEAPLVAQARNCQIFLLLDRGEVHLVATPEVELEPVQSVDGARHLARVSWSRSPSTLLLDGEAGSAATNEAFDRAALGVAAMLTGLGRRMLDMTVSYATERKQFGVPIGSFQAVKHHLADAALALEFAEPLVLRAANALANRDRGASVDVSMAKARASSAALAVAAAALQVHGAIGYTVEYDLHLYMKRAWALAARYGDAEFHRRRVRGGVLGV